MGSRDAGKQKAAKLKRRNDRKAKEQAAQGAREARRGWAESLARDLLDEGLTTEGLDEAQARLPAGQRTTLARDLFAAFLALDLRELAPPDVWKIAPSLTYLFGPDAARAGFAALPPAGGHARLLLEAALEPPTDEAAEPARPPVEAGAEARRAGLAAFRPRDAASCLELVLGVPADFRPMLAEDALAILRPEIREGFAVLGLLTPALGPATRAVLAGDLARDRSHAALSFLASLDEATLGPGLLAFVRHLLMKAGWSPAIGDGMPLLPSDPRAWPVLEVLASVRDGGGSQVTYLLRRRAPGLYAFYGVVDNAARGAVDASCAFDLDEAGLRKLRVFLADTEVAATKLAPAEAERRMAGSIARCLALGHPVPYEAALGQAMLAGVASAPRPAVPRAPRTPAALAETGALLHTAETAALRIRAADSLAAAAFIDEAFALAQGLEAGKRSRGGKPTFPAAIARELTAAHQLKLAPATVKALDALAARHADAVMTGSVRQAWRETMQRAAAAFAKTKRPALAALAEAAAAALDPASGTAAGAQPFVRAAMVFSLMSQVGRPATRSGFFAFIDPVLAALPLDWPEEKLRQALLALAEVWNAGAAGRPMAGPLDLARIALGSLLMSTPARRQQAHAAIGELPARWALDFAGERELIADVRVARVDGRLGFEVIPGARG